MLSEKSQDPTYGKSFSDQERFLSGEKAFLLSPIMKRKCLILRILLALPLLALISLDYPDNRGNHFCTVDLCTAVCCQD